MIIGVDASNIRSGGGQNYLVRILEHADPLASGISRVMVWSGSRTAARLPKREWLITKTPVELDRGLPWRVNWQQCRLPRLLEEHACDLLWSPGGSAPARGRVPSVTVFQNALPFEVTEAARYPAWSTERMRLRLLRGVQARSMRESAGVILISQYAHSLVAGIIPDKKTALIRHGIEDRFRLAPRSQEQLSHFTWHNPLKVLYVSPVDAYKHQWHVAEAVARLREEGLPLVVDFVGPLTYRPAVDRLHSTTKRLDPEGRLFRVVGHVPYSDLVTAYHQADVFVFASTCENLPMTLLEAMAAGLPIAASNRPPMPEVLGDCGIFFDPENPSDIASALRLLVADPTLRAELAAKAHSKAEQYSWEDCAAATFRFLAECVP